MHAYAQTEVCFGPGFSVEVLDTHIDISFETVILGNDASKLNI